MTRSPALLGASLAPKATAIAGYYLFDTGGNFTSMVGAAIGIDIGSMLANFNATRDNEIAVPNMSNTYVGLQSLCWDRDCVCVAAVPFA